MEGEAKAWWQANAVEWTKGVGSALAGLAVAVVLVLFLTKVIAPLF